MATYLASETSAQPETAKRQIAIYARVSTEEQASKGHSLEAKVVRTIFRHNLKRKGIRLVTNYLNKRWVSTRNGGKWIDNTVGVILSRETYDGVLKIGDVVI